MRSPVCFPSVVAPCVSVIQHPLGGKGLGQVSLDAVSFGLENMRGDFTCEFFGFVQGVEA